MEVLEIEVSDVTGISLAQEDQTLWLQVEWSSYSKNSPLLWKKRAIWWPCSTGPLKVFLKTPSQLQSDS